LLCDLALVFRPGLKHKAQRQLATPLGSLPDTLREYVEAALDIPRERKSKDVTADDEDEEDVEAEAAEAAAKRKAAAAAKKRKGKKKTDDDDDDEDDDSDAAGKKKQTKKQKAAAAAKKAEAARKAKQDAQKAAKKAKDAKKADDFDEDVEPEVDQDQNKGTPPTVCVCAGCVRVPCTTKTASAHVCAVWCGMQSVGSVR